MKLRNVVIVVKDIKKSAAYYEDLFGLSVLFDQGGNVIMSEGLVLQDEKIWTDFIGKEAIPKSNSCLLYFEEREIERFVQKLEEQYPDTCYLNRLTTTDQVKKFVRFYDPDGNLIEVAAAIENYSR